MLTESEWETDTKKRGRALFRHHGICRRKASYLVLVASLSNWLVHCNICNDYLLKMLKSQIISGGKVEVVWVCDEKRGTLRRNEGDGNESSGEKEERKT